MSASDALPPDEAAGAGLVVSRRDGEFVVRGEFDLAGVAAFERAFVDHQSPDGVHLDLSEMTFLDSSGVSALIRLRKRLRRDGHDLELRHPSRGVAETLHLMGLDTVFTIVE